MKDMALYREEPYSGNASHQGCDQPLQGVRAPGDLGEIQ